MADICERDFPKARAIRVCEPFLGRAAYCSSSATARQPKHLTLLRVTHFLLGRALRLLLRVLDNFQLSGGKIASLFEQRQYEKG